MAKGVGGEPNGQTDLHLIPKTRHPAPRIPLCLSLSLQQALPLVTQLQLSRGRLPVAEKNEKTKNLQEQYLVRKGEGKTKENAAGFEETSESQSRKAVFPGQFCHKYHYALLVANATVFTSSRQECVGQRLPCLSRSSRSVCAHCAGVSWRERRPPTPEPNLKPNLNCKPVPETSLICDLHRFPNQTPGLDSRFRT